MTDEILARQDGPILRITINQPARGNAVSNEMVAAMTKLVIGAEPDADLIVIRGAGKDFCLGRFRGAAPPAPPEALELRDSSDTIFDFYRALRGAKVPVVCAVQGSAIGFGCALAAGCDIALAAADAMFQTPEMEHNILPTVVLSTFVDRLPRKALAYLVYSSAAIDAERALSFGLVSDIVPAAGLDAALERLCAAILKAPPAAIRGAKEYLRSAPDMPIDGAVDYARNLHAVINSSARMRAKRH